VVQRLSFEERGRVLLDGTRIPEAFCAAPKLHFVSASRSPGGARGGDEGMLETIAIILIILWLLGMVSGYTLGNFIWVLLVIAVVLFLVRLVSGRRVV
jgi:hypothetical protein